MGPIKPVSTDWQRPVLSVVLTLLGLLLAAGGTMLATLGGSLYYLLAGLAVLLSAWWLWKGDQRGLWLYRTMLAGTTVWTLAEAGTEPWQWQARLLAPSLLSIWVFWSSIWSNWRTSLALLLLLGAGSGVWLWSGDRPESVLDAPQTSPLADMAGKEWRHYGKDQGGSRFSPLTSISASNVADLKVAWTHRTGIAGRFEATPLMTNGRLYFCTSNNIVTALDPETGTKLWSYDPGVDTPPIAACRGVAYNQTAGSGRCTHRIILATTDARLIAIDANNGTPCAGFGNSGTVDLTSGMGEVGAGYYYVSSPPAIVRGRIVVGGFILDNQHVDEPSGVIRAFDAETGQFAWAWDMDKPGFSSEPPPGQSYSRATANSWAPISGDENLGLFFLPMGNATPDYWGGHRSEGSEKYSSGVVAIDAETGVPRWYFQATHHDLWDYDVASQPTLIDLEVAGRSIPAMIVASKRGQIFILDRRDGKPVFPIAEIPAPKGATPGDFSAATQPRSSLPGFDGPLLSEKSMWGLTPLDQLWCRIKFRQSRYEGPMTPPGLQPAIIYPGSFGGINWGGVSVDPRRKFMVVNWNLMANRVRLVHREEADRLGVKLGEPLVIGRPMPQMGTPFAVAVTPFMSPLGVPCNTPPFGKIAVVDLTTGKLTWSRSLGTSTDSGPLGISLGLPLPMGVPNIGGSFVTGSGLIFIAATQEHALRAFDLLTGKLLWKARLPAGGNATPMTYIGPKSGRQFVVIAAGGHPPLGSGAGDYVIAFSLSEN